MNNELYGNAYKYTIDTSYGINQDGFVAIGTESIVYKGLKTKKEGGLQFSCVLKFKPKAIVVDGQVVDRLRIFKEEEWKIFEELRECRSIVRIDDVIEDLGDFNLPCDKTNSGVINGAAYFCVVEEFIDGWNLDEFCREEYWKLRRTEPLDNGLSRSVGFHDFSESEKQAVLQSYHYDNILKYQNQILLFMTNLCEILQFVTEQKNILHLDIKPDNIMVTRYGKELVLIDFGKSRQITKAERFTSSTLAAADYGEPETLEKPFQYGTLGYAAPECFVPAGNGSAFPFPEARLTQGSMSIESDIFAFGATFWECLNIFELYTGIEAYARDKDSGSNEFYRTHILRDAAYHDRDLSLTSSYYHERLERILQKCTAQRTAGYAEPDNDRFYHSYAALKHDIEYARDSAPSLVKTENIKVRNSFGVAGVMLGFVLTLGVVSLVLKLSGSYFAQRKLDTIIDNYNPTKIEWLESAAVEQMQSSSESEKHAIYDKIYTFLWEQDETLDYAEVVVLVELLREIEEPQFVGESVNAIVLNVEKKRLSESIQYTVTNLGKDVSSDGYVLATHIYNAQNRKNLLDCYAALQSYAAKTEADPTFTPLVKKLAQSLNHDEIINRIAQETLAEAERAGGAEQDATALVGEIRSVLNEINQE